MEHPDITAALLTGYPAAEYSELERQKAEMQSGPYDEFDDFFKELYEQK